MIRTKAIYYFASRDDFAPGLTRLEDQRKIKYVQVLFSDMCELIEHDSAIAIPSLGISTTGDHNHDPTYLVMPRDAVVNVRTVPQSHGGTKYAVDSVANPNAVTWWPGGIYEPARCLIRGELNVDSTNLIALGIYKSFVKHVSGPFLRWKQYRLGTNAVHLYRLGYRLTPSRAFSESVDLKIPDDL